MRCFSYKPREPHPRGACVCWLLEAEEASPTHEPCGTPCHSTPAHNHKSCGAPYSYIHESCRGLLALSENAHLFHLRPPLLIGAHALLGGCPVTRCHHL